ncbi:Bov2.b3 [Bovine gammaherpesvirus 6]|uniref:Bov2.b3 n=1 Tax=Bovine gammaherpesvirus 6 TaxID=1504288 RepID=A0A060D3K7_9GAMA|nr:Bov2.b3 [Bovine gammaherpesvirus 6]AIB03160.1 Bov2.b3 [Bovine gammaherpesvirus 6]
MKLVFAAALWYNYLSYTTLAPLPSQLSGLLGSILFQVDSLINGSCSNFHCDGRNGVILFEQSQLPTPAPECLSSNFNKTQCLKWSLDSIASYYDFFNNMKPDGNVQGLQSSLKGLRQSLQQNYPNAEIHLINKTESNNLSQTPSMQRYQDGKELAVMQGLSGLIQTLQRVVRL